MIHHEKVRATEQWLKRMQQEGQALELQTLRVHMLDPKGNKTLEWILGEDVDLDTVKKCRDEETGDLFAMTHYEKGQPVVSILKKDLWCEAKHSVDWVKV